VRPESQIPPQTVRQIETLVHQALQAQTAEAAARAAREYHERLQEHERSLELMRSVEQLTSVAQEREHHLEDIRASWSWRITAPLRAVAGALLRVVGK
jgi:hypothetical protein